MEQMNRRKRVRCESEEEFEVNSTDVKRFREDLLDDLDESEFCATNLDLDSFMKSFEDEITSSPAPAPATEVVDLTSESGESQPELGYLLEASDDELGLPPATASPAPSETEDDLVRVTSDSSELSGELWRLDERFTNYDDSFDLGIYEHNDFCEYVAIDDGLFDHSDLSFGSGDFLWRPETLPAL